MDLAAQILDTWRIAARLNIFLLDSLPPEALAIKGAKGKSVGGQLSHIHSVRLMWLKASGPDLMQGLDKLDDSAPCEQLRVALESSAIAVERLLERGLADGKIKNFKPHPTAFLGYLIAHEADHRGQAQLILRQAGQPLTDKAMYGLWEWGTR